MEDADVALIQSAQHKDPEAFARLVRNYQHFVYRTAYGVLQNRTDAEDVAQETFIKAYQSLSKLKEPRTFPTWIARIAVRTALDHVSRRNRHRHTSLHESLGVASHEPMYDAHHRMDLEKALAMLDPDGRTILVLRELHGFDYETMAEVLGIPTGTVRSRLHRARQQLRQYLADDNQPGGDSDGL